MYAGFHYKILPLRSGAWRFYSEPSGYNLAYIKTWQIPLRHNSHQADRKLICEHVGVYSVRMCVKGVYEVKSIAAKREKRQELIFSFGCMGRMGKSQK